MSVRWSMSRLLSQASGDMYCGVPSNTPAAVLTAVAAENTLASPQMYNFTGRSVIITGGAGILGGEIACALVGCGALVASQLDFARGLIARVEAGEISPFEAYQLMQAENTIYTACLNCNTGCVAST